MAYVYSTLTNGVVYTGYNKTADGLNMATYEIEILGGHGLMNKNFIVNEGTATFVTDEQLEVLLKDVHFQNHMKEGFIKYEKSDKNRRDPDKAVSDLKKRDKSAPLVEEDFKDGEAPKVNA